MMSPRIAVPAVDRFLPRVDRSGGADSCWPWLGAPDVDGYGSLAITHRKSVRAHRFAYELWVGEIPEGMQVCHHCDNPPCCNPAHLFVGTNLDNVADMVAKGRHGHGDTHPARLRPERMRRGDQHPLRLHPEYAARGERNGKYTKPERTPRGEQHGRSKLTEERVIEIRRRYAQGNTTQDELAAEFGVTFSAISRVVLRKTWKHVP